MSSANSLFGLFENGKERNCPETRPVGYREIAAAFTTAPLNEVRKNAGGAAQKGAATRLCQ
jgi:hypothetical protein